MVFEETTKEGRLFHNGIILGNKEVFRASLGLSERLEILDNLESRGIVQCTIRYLCSEYKGAGQLCGYHLHLCFSHLQRAAACIFCFDYFRYNPENLGTLERYVDMQVRENTYDLEANLGVLKL